MNQTLTYQVFKVAYEKYEKSLDDLDLQQHQDALRIAQRKIAIEEAVLSSAEASRVSVSDAQIETAFEEIKGRYQHEQEFLDDIAKLGIDEAFYYKALSRELHVEAVLDMVSGEFGSVSDTEVSLFYYMNLQRFVVPEIRTGRHILVTINEDTQENSRAASWKKISMIEKRLTSKPDRFEEQALKHSECPTSLKGGLLGQVKSGVLYPEVESALFLLSPGELSPVVESPLGFHLVRCDAIQPESTAPLPQVQEKLKKSLENRKRKQEQRRWLNQLINKQSSPQGERLSG